MGGHHLRGGILQLLDLVEERRAAVDYDFRTRFRMGWDDLPEAMGWDERPTEQHGDAVGLSPDDVKRRLAAAAGRPEPPI
jgi:hypothetical protein